MARMQQRFVLVTVPRTQTEANTLSKTMTQEQGADGWRLVAVTVVANGGTLLLAFEQPMD